MLERERERKAKVIGSLNFLPNFFLVVVSR
jgi:hypothetical protein